MKKKFGWLPQNIGYYQKRSEEGGDKVILKGDK